MKTVVITGAGKGIGFEMVKTFLNDPAYKVMATSRNTDKLAQIPNSRLQIITGDLIKDYPYIINEMIKTGNSIDIVINNAALVLNKLMIDVQDEDINEVMQTNFFTPYKLIRDISPLLMQGAHIINISSMSGFQGSKKFAGLSLYSASKAALASLSECIAAEWKDKQVYCNCLALGAVDTDMIKVSIPGLEPTVAASQMADYIYKFAITGHQYYNGQVLPVTLTTL